MCSHSFALRSALTLILLHTVLAPGGGLSAEKTIIGAVEDVVLLPWRVRIPARIDTGATRTSLGAQDLTISGVVAEFKLRDAVGGHRLRLPILDWRIYKTGGGTQRRPIVEIEICIGRKRLRTRVNLNQRRHLRYPLLIGRGVLVEGNFLVDVTKYRMLNPACSTTRVKPQSVIPPGLIPDRR